MVYFDNAATSWPKPRQTEKAVRRAFKRYGANPGRGGHEAAVKTAEMVYRTREAAAKLLGINEAERLIFTANCTASANIAIKGFLKKGSHVIISSMEHNAVRRPVCALARAGVITYDTAFVDMKSEENTVKNFARLLRPNTRLLCCVHGSNVFGTLQPVEKIARLAHENGAAFLLDAAQTGGVYPIDAEKTGADFITFAAHKGLFAPTALGLLAVLNDAPLETLLEGGSGALSKSESMPPFLPERLEAGTLNTMGIAGLSGGIQFIKKRGIEKIYHHEMAIIGYLYEAFLQMPGVILYNRPQIPVLSFNLRGKTGEETAALLNQRGFALRGGFHCSPSAHETMGTEKIGTARISAGAFNTVKEAAALVREVQKIMQGP